MADDADHVDDAGDAIDVDNDDGADDADDDGDAVDNDGDAVDYDGDADDDAGADLVFMAVCRPTHGSSILFHSLQSHREGWGRGGFGVGRGLCEDIFAAERWLSFLF